MDEADRERNDQKKKCTVKISRGLFCKHSGRHRNHILTETTDDTSKHVLPLQRALKSVRMKQLYRNVFISD